MSTTEPTVPYGFCHCGCGEKTTIARQSSSARGMVRGEPIRFVHGHNSFKAVHHKVEDRGFETPCWIWQLTLNDDGHGYTSVRGRGKMAHRLYYERVYGPLPRTTHLHHRCEVRACVNPDHLEPMTPAAHKQEHSRLTWEIVRDIRARRESGASLSALVERFGLSKGHLSEICNYKAWKEPT